MEPVICAHCGIDIEGEGIRHRRRLFCGDECCEAFEDGFLSHGEPDAADLEEEEDEDLFDEDLFDADDDEIDEEIVDDDDF